MMMRASRSPWDVESLDYTTDPFLVPGFGRRRAGIYDELEGPSGPLPGEQDFVRAQLLAGVRNLNRLTDLVFFRRHPELGGAKLRRGQEGLMAEWRAILNRVVSPTVAASSGGAPRVTSTNPRVRTALARWNMPTGVPGATAFYQLVERWRGVHCPEIPLHLLVAFSSLEASGFADATHGTPGNHYTSPNFYELGVFQVPAGLHGSCTGGRYDSCQYQPPGRSAGADAWHKICARLGLNPKAWLDPTTQVRVGLENLETDARTTRARFPELFPNPGSDWDLRAAVLMPFGPGIGFTLGVLGRSRRTLANMPENARWSYLKSRGVKTDNMDAKMSLAQSLAGALSSAGARELF
jgi:hypothetical protein